VSALLAVSIGNTRVGLGVFAGPAVEGPPLPDVTVSVPLPQGGAFSPEFEAGTAVDAAVVASVNPPATAPVLDWIAASFDVDPLLFPRDLPPGLANRCDPPDAVGADRLANAVAAYDEFRTTCIVVDAGTAITVDVVSADGPAFLGGAILPGPALAARALSQGTALLPELALTDTAAAVGASTAAAVSSGVLRGLAGAADRLISDIRDEVGICEHTVVTGGDADWLMRYCEAMLAARPHLTLSGLAAAYRAHGPGSSAR